LCNKNSCADVQSSITIRIQALRGVFIQNNNNNDKDVAISGDRNVIKKAAEMALKYKDLILELHRMWNVKAEVIPVIIGGGWDHFKITQTEPEQRDGDTRN